ncbi:hypothetical protein CYMTET_23302 [Cymbomonas tetramitiformis]|uniref:Uncharacterized protein n=1 Tax=Cymbomonas tetramitiformis TaxID=36881 RepID=A0AAE0FYS9_9CHLO|nr:hypothetical protein CYMTET_23302 [Cymbomonas tetramitiformis]
MPIVATTSAMPFLVNIFNPRGPIGLRKRPVSADVVSPRTCRQLCTKFKNNERRPVKLQLAKRKCVGTFASDDPFAAREEPPAFFFEVPVDGGSLKVRPLCSRTVTYATQILKKSAMLYDANSTTSEFEQYLVECIDFYPSGAFLVACFKPEVHEDSDSNEETE